MLSIKAIATISTILCMIFIVISYSYQASLFVPKNIATNVASPYKKISIKLKDDVLYLQKDARWAMSSLGTGVSTIGAEGCLLSSVAMALTNLGLSITPQQLNNKLISINGFTHNGWIIWDKIRELTDNKFSVEIYQQPSHKNIINCLENKKYPLVKFYLLGMVQHWAIITKIDQGQYKIRDPLINKP